jgi:hypothetical protein
MVEQLTLNQRVGGSSPPRFTKSFQGRVCQDLLAGVRQPLTLNVQSIIFSASLSCFARRLRFYR